MNSDGGQLAFGMLGPLQVPDSNGHIAEDVIHAAKHRILISVLLIRRNQSVPIRSLIDEIWGDEPPGTAENLVRQYVSQLRRKLAPAGNPGSGSFIETRPSGYVLHLEPNRFDRDVFEEHVRAAERLVAAGDITTGEACLSQALKLWRGPALSDVQQSPIVIAEANRLGERLIGARELLLQTMLSASRSDEVVSEASALVSENPYREKLRALQIRALYSGGRRADALEACLRVRQDLSELGLEPGPELVALHAAVLRDDPTLVVHVDDPVSRNAHSAVGVVNTTPAQLPRDLPDFVEDATTPRSEDVVAASDDLADPVTVVSGMVGMGKTALTVRRAHEAIERFPDGQVFVDLKGEGDNPEDPEVTIRRVLRSFGMSEDDVPRGLDAASAFYRSQMAFRRVLVILDNARDESQIRPLLLSGPIARVVITSRRVLPGVDGATQIRLNPMSDELSLRMFTAVVGVERVQQEPEAARKVVGACAGMPLALRIAGTTLAARPHAQIAGLAKRLESRDVLDYLEIGGIELRPRLASAVDSLSERQRVLLHAIGRLGDDLTAEATGRLSQCGKASVNVDTLEDDLDELVDQHVVQAVRHESQQHVTYRVNRLLREHLRTCSDARVPLDC